jgi:predicted Zn-dependent protease with MMP-like domain
MDYKHSLQKAKDFADIFHLVKNIVRNYLNTDQAGLLLGLSDLGAYGQSYLGAFYSFDANTIVINKRPLTKIKETNPNLYNPYIFHVLLHEYIHSLGVVEEDQVRNFVYEITEKYFGKNHLATQIAFDLEKFLPNLTFGDNFEPPEDMSIEFISGIDRDNTDYIM